MLRWNQNENEEKEATPEPLLIHEGPLHLPVGIFCGTCLELQDFLSRPLSESDGRQVYLSGDMETLLPLVQARLARARRCSIIRELSSGFEPFPSVWTVPLGRVPVVVGDGQALYFPRLFSAPAGHLFAEITREHEFQSLTESNKPGTALRKGIYLSDVRETQEGGLEFHLLRCSSNFDGPTDCFRPIDREIIRRVTEACEPFFDRPAPFNHVLAQTYHNDSGRKAKIKAHSDKTEDMPSNGLIAFCTFYGAGAHSPRWSPKASSDDPLGTPSFDVGTDVFNVCRNGQSLLTRLYFRRKDDAPSHLPSHFEVTLYPNSVLVIPLSTNRYYTHEIRPSLLPPAFLPTRLGYVIRCSKTVATHSPDGETLIDGEPLRPMTDDDARLLRGLYYDENSSSQPVHYPEKILFSMNGGDYRRPSGHSRSPGLTVKSVSGH